METKEESLSLMITDRREFTRVFASMERMAIDAGMGLVQRTQLITATSELITNAVKYAGRGNLVG